MLFAYYLCSWVAPLVKVTKRAPQCLALDGQISLLYAKLNSINYKLDAEYY